MSAYPPLLLSRTGEHEADIVWDDENKSSALNGVTYEFAERIVACVNACKDIPTESLTALDWQLAPKAGARPINVAKLLLKMDVYRNAMARLVVQAKACNFTDEEGHQLTMNTAYQAIQEALK